jgi:nucleoside-diphosphate-sugar epimerase
MIIGILGAGGFIGSNLIGYLLARGEHQLVGVDITDDKLAGIDGPQFQFIEADVRTDRDIIDAVTQRVDVVVDLVAHANPSIYVETPLDVVAINFFENHRVLEMCVRHEKRRGGGPLLRGHLEPDDGTDKQATLDLRVR